MCSPAPHACGVSVGGVKRLNLFAVLIFLANISQKTAKMLPTSLLTLSWWPFSPKALVLTLLVVLIIGHTIRLISDAYKNLVKNWLRWVLWALTVISILGLICWILHNIYSHASRLYSPESITEFYAAGMSWFAALPNSSAFPYVAITLLCIGYGELRARVFSDVANGAVTRDTRLAKNDELVVNMGVLKDLTTVIHSIMQPPMPTTPLPTEAFKAVIVEQLNQILPPLLLTLPTANFTAELTENILAEVEDVKAYVRALTTTVYNQPPTQPQPFTPNTSQPKPAPRSQPQPAKSEKHPIQLVTEDESGSDEEEGWVNVAKKVRISDYKAATSSRIADSRKPPSSARTAKLSDPLNYDMTEADLLDNLKQREAARREAQRAAKSDPEFLTDEERNMTMDELHRKFKVENQRRFSEAADLRATDFEPLGDLTAEQKQLPRFVVKRLIRQRKHQLWVEEMQARGVPLHRCDVCHELTTDSHRCVATRWLTQGNRNSAIAKGVVVSTGPSGIRVHTAPIVNPPQLRKEFQKLQAWSAKMDDLDRQTAPHEQATQATPPPPLEDSTETLDTSMDTQTESVPPSINV